MLHAERAARGNKVVLRLEGKAPEKVDPDDGASQRKAAKRLGVSEAEVAAALLQLEPEGEPAPAAAFVVEGWAVGGESRQWVGDDGDSPSDVLDAALAEAGATCEFFRWSGRSRLCSLDVDRRKGFPEVDPGPLLRSIGPQPKLWWPSRSGGLRLVFEADAPGTGFELTAEQKAGAFALCAPSLRSANVLRVELLASTRTDRGLRATASLRYGVADLPGALRGDGGSLSVDPADVAGWLADRGLELGGRYSHERCPFDPGPGSRGDPVVVGEEGVHCYRCAGVTGRGSAPWARLLKAERPTTSLDPVVAAASARVHWTQADLLLQAHVPQLGPGVRRAAYHALLSMFDPESADAALTWGTLPGLVRAEGGWLFWPSGGTAPITVSSTRGLPWARNVPEAIETAGRAPREPLAGYVPVRPTRCLVDAPELRDGVVVAPLLDDREAPLEQPVRSLDDALTELRLAVPVPDAFCTALKLLVLMGMRAQRAPAVPGFLLVDGKSGSGKGFAVQLAAGVLGGGYGRVLTDTLEDMDMSIGEAVTTGAALVHVDEVGKLGSMWSRSAPLLALSDRIAWRKLFVGPVSAPMTAGVVFTGSTLPSGLVTMREFQRRMVRVTLPEGRPASDDWERRFLAYFGESAANVMRTPVGRRWAEALRRWARGEANSNESWVDHAVSHGATRLEDDDEAVELANVVASLYAVWQKGVDRVEAGKRHAGWLKGWEGEAATILADWWVADTPEARQALAGRLATAHVGVCDHLMVRVVGARFYLKFE